ncbi:MAG TPA: hypothetical protein EYN26_05835 [Chromatiales bacterium]|jgi:hypothetical protein|nr:hypothetical protein [Chromatiales bacterium]HIO13907.1 hypothetical protein [Chromatiales bacterium]HIO54645.1 hypothetical protein [Chromatiales bacterium]
MSEIPAIIDVEASGMIQRFRWETLHALIDEMQLTGHRASSEAQILQQTYARTGAMIGELVEKALG